MLRAFYLVAAALSLGNALWMLAAPASWFFGLPAALPDTGPLNLHLVRDFGVAFAVMGVALAWCTRNPSRARGVHVAATAFLAAHALVHVVDLLGGRLPHRHWLLDVPFTFLPPLLFLALLPAAARAAAEARPASPSA
jgi:hypothetical protein